MGQIFAKEEFGELCFELGLELGEVVTEKTVLFSGDGASLH
jgi:hypothetical protein